MFLVNGFLPKAAKWYKTRTPSFSM
jgi:hypothetical protein